jgi:hypothetical protein
MVIFQRNCSDESGARQELLSLSEKVSHVLLGNDVITTTTSLLSIDLVVKFLNVFPLLRLRSFFDEGLVPVVLLY